MVRSLGRVCASDVESDWHLYRHWAPCIAGPTRLGHGSRIRTCATGLSAASERYTGVIFTVLGGASHKRDVFHDFCVFCGSLTWALRFKRIESVEHCCV